MPSVHRNPRSPFWTASVRIWVPLADHPQGGFWRHSRRSTRIPATEPKRSAALVAAEIERQANEAHLNRPADPRAFWERAVSRMMLAAGVEPPDSCPTWRSWSEGWLDSRHGSPRSLMAYRSHIERFTKHMGARSRASLKDITPSDCQAFLERLRGERLAGSTVRVVVKTVRSCLERARLSGLIPLNPAALVEIPTEPERLNREAFTLAQVRQILAHIDRHESEDWRTAVLFGALYGLRLRDAIRRRREEIDGEGVLRFVPMKKARTGRAIALPLVGPLAHLEAGAGWITPDLAAMSNPSKVFTRILAGAGIHGRAVQAADRTLSTLSFHSLRHSCASWLTDAGVEATVRRLIADHDSEAVHARYSKPALATIAAALGKVAGGLSK